MAFAHCSHSCLSRRLVLLCSPTARASCLTASLSMSMTVYWAWSRCHGPSDSKNSSRSRRNRSEAEKKAYTTHKTGTRPSHALQDYLGEYEHPGYGTVRIDLEKAELRLAYNKKGFSPLKHFH